MAETANKEIIIIGVDDSEESTHALQWTLQHLLAPFASIPFKLVLLHARPTVTSIVRAAGPVTRCLERCNCRLWFECISRIYQLIHLAAAGAAEVFPYVESNLKTIGRKALESAKAVCEAHNVEDAETVMVEGDARSVLCEAVDKYSATLLVVGSHGYGAIKRAVLGSVSDYCAHHAKCTVMIVKKPKH